MEQKKTLYEKVQVLDARILGLPYYSFVLGKYLANLMTTT